MRNRIEGTIYFFLEIKPLYNGIHNNLTVVRDDNCVILLQFKSLDSFSRTKPVEWFLLINQCKDSSKLCKCGKISKDYFSTAAGRQRQKIKAVEKDPDHKFHGF